MTSGSPFRTPSSLTAIDPRTDPRAVKAIETPTQPLARSVSTGH
jgi:hypothetical protein